MAGFQLPTVGQVAGVAPTISQISVGTAAPQAQSRALSQEAIQRHITSAQRVGPLVYWQVGKPARQLKLTGAVNYVNKNFASQPANNRFVYWDQYRVAGLVSDIVSAFRQAGLNVSEDMVRSQARDPLAPQQRAAIEAAAAQAPTAEKPKAKHTFEEYLQIGQVIKQASKAPSGVAAVKGAPGVRGGRSPEANRSRLFNELSQAMQTVISGMEVPKVFDVSKFDASKFSGARKVTPPKSARATAIRPVINVGGRPVAIPIIAQPAGAGNFRAFVQSVVAGTPYAQYVDEILTAFNARLQPMTVAPVGMQFIAAQPTFAVPTVAQPFVAPMAQLQRVASPTRPGSVSPISSPVRTVALPAVGARPIGLPQVGTISGLPMVRSTAAPSTFRLPSVGTPRM